MKREAAIKRMTKKEKEALAGRASGSLKDLAGGECAGMEGTG